MKIKYNLEYNYLSIYDEMQGIIANKHALYRNDYSVVTSYTKSGFKFIKYAIIEFIVMIIFNLLPIPLLLTDIINFIFAVTVGGLVAYYVIFFSLYTVERNRSHRGELLIDEFGILDTSEDNIRIGIPWHYIECIIITDNIICFMSKVVASFVITINHYEEVIEALSKYQSDLKVLDKRYIRRNIIKEEPKEEKIVDEEEIIEKLEEEVKTEKKEEKKEASKKSTKKKKDSIDRTIEDVEKAIKELTED